MTTTEPTTYRVTIVGPNLPRPLCDKGTFHVHKAGCADLKRGALGRAHAGPSAGFDMLVTDRLQVEADVYDFAPAENEDYTVGDYQSDFHFAPCLDELPLDSEPEAAAAPAPTGATFTPDERENAVRGVLRTVDAVVAPLSPEHRVDFLRSLIADLEVIADAETMRAQDRPGTGSATVARPPQEASHDRHRDPRVRVPRRDTDRGRPARLPLVPGQRGRLPRR
jgi:hypothetical protein